MKHISIERVVWTHETYHIVDYTMLCFDKTDHFVHIHCFQKISIVIIYHVCFFTHMCRVNSWGEVSMWETAVCKGRTQCFKELSSGLTILAFDLVWHENISEINWYSIYIFKHEKKHLPSKMYLLLLLNLSIEWVSYSCNVRLKSFRTVM